MAAAAAADEAIESSGSMGLRKAKGLRSVQEPNFKREMTKCHWES
jgi:hypothetical protein